MIRAFFDRWGRNRTVLVVILMGTYSAQSLLITASKQKGIFAYDTTVTVLLAELLKLFFALTLLPPEARAELNLRRSFPYMVPAILYTVQNALVFEALRYISPPQYQLLNNLKMFTTAITYRVVMQRPLKVLQWLALALLAVGIVLATQQTAAESQAGASTALWGAGHVHGVFLMVIVSWCSAFAGVSNEYLIKRSLNMLEANVWLYAYGCLACALRLVLARGSGTSDDIPTSVMTLFRGFTATTWLVVLCNAVLGQSVAYIFRYADSIVKLYAICAAMCFTTATSVLFFGFQLHFQMVGGFAACAISICLYYCPAELLLSTDSELLSGVCKRSSRNGQETKKDIPNAKADSKVE